MSSYKPAAPGVRVAKCQFGRGVFAKWEFEEGDCLGEVRGRVIQDPEYGSNYCMDLGNDCSLEPRSPFRYLNHCCEPNCQIAFEEIDFDTGLPLEIPRLYIQAIQDIEKGEQLTIDYAWSADSAIPCGCGSENCRGWIVDEKEWCELQARLTAAVIGDEEE
ncbi:SET domain-containing protein-lysine N-methyltransferase [Planctomycetales bacterium 10988]|nr:SET domain-containing protein-lysine N-methyltransferase [Planctomycetales bacterium 10988]